MADEGFRDRLAKQSEDALGKLAQDLLENPLVNGAISRAFGAREKATQAQEAALGALNIPSAADVERLTRRLRSVSQRLEGIEDGVDRLDQRLAALKADGANPLAAVNERLAAIEGQLAKLSADVGTLAGAVDPAPVPREQERREVDKAPANKARKPRTKKSASS
jgi:CRP-like cAMP-binding protein